MDQARTDISEVTRRAERDEASAPHQPDRMPTPEEEEAAGESRVDEEVAEHCRDMAERGAAQKGEGRTQ